MNRYFDKVVICYLVINKITEYPVLAIQSCLDNSNLNIILGYLNEIDVAHLPKSPRIQLLKLESDLCEPSKNYVGFDNLEFYRIVTLKWRMFQSLFEKGYEHLIYSDLDVIWFRDVSKKLVEIHEKFPQKSILIQDATFDPATPRLCMGLLSIRKTRDTLNMLQTCYESHVAKVESGIMFGDDDAISNFYLENGGPDWIGLLPQASFPVGNLLNSYIRKPLIPGLRPMFEAPNPFRPYIFHANYVIGEMNKRLLIRVALQEITDKFTMTPKWVLILHIKRLRELKRNILARIRK